MDNLFQEDLSVIARRSKKISISVTLNVFLKEELVEISRELDIPGRSTMNKGDLVSALTKHIKCEANFQDILTVAYPREWELFISLLEEPCISADSIPFGYYRYLVERALVTAFEYEGKSYLIIPDEVSLIYEKLDKDLFFARRARHQLVYSYIKAMINLYGMFTPQKLIEIFNSQNSEKTDLEEFYRIYMLFSRRQQTFRMAMDHIVSDSFESEDEITGFFEKTKDKPFYIPDRDELLKYSDNGYFEMTPQLAALKNFIMNNLTRDEDIVDYLIDDVQLRCSREQPIQSVIDEFNRRYITFTSEQQFKDMLPYIVEVYNNTRIWTNRGHTPKEMSGGSVKPRHIDNSTVNFMVSRQAVSHKIGRNDPCPCGSGKKYKKCCGK